MKMYEPMLASPATEFPVAGEWCIQPKIDGWRCLSYVTKDGVKMFTRNGNRCDAPVVYLTDVLAALPVGTVLDGEVYGGTFGHTQSVMETSTAHVPNEHSPALELLVFDVLQVGTFPTVGLPLRDRLELVQGTDLASLPLVHDLPTTLNPVEAHHQAYLDHGFEGSVLKRLDSTYRGGRQKDWLKLKPTETSEGRIVGYRAGKNGIVGLVGAVEVELESGVRTTISGFSLEQRLAFTHRPDEFLGRMIEFRHNGWFPSGSPRHPRWSRFRPDRD